MNFTRRRFLHLAAGAATLPGGSHIAQAQSYPSRPITMILPLAAGGLLDALGRVLAERMSRSLGQTIVIENVTGANGSIGTGRTARARPDGYTIELGNKGTHVLNGAYYSLPYDPLNDFVPIALLGTTWMILFGRKNMRAEDLKELIVWLRANPNTASAGFGGGDSHLATAFFQKVVGARVALVPYRGSAPAMQDLVADQIDVLFGNVDQLSLARAGSIKAYAVTSDTRLPAAPDIPTFREMGLPALSYPIWVGLFAPKGTPKAIIDKLNTAVVEALADAAVRSRADLLPEIAPRERQTPEALGALQRADAEKWWPIIKELGIKAE